MLNNDIETILECLAYSRDEPTRSGSNQHLQPTHLASHIYIVCLQTSKISQQLGIVHETILIMVSAIYSRVTSAISETLIFVRVLSSATCLNLLFGQAWALTLTAPARNNER
jgi:hypothetical protein